jgi:hypothetical protein
LFAALAAWKPRQVMSRLSASMNNNGGTGSVSIIELLTFPDGSGQSMEVSLPGASSSSLSFTGVQTILVQEDLFLDGGSLGANVNSLDNALTSPAIIPEPTSIISLGIGMAAVVLAEFRRFSKRRSS